MDYGLWTNQIVHITYGSNTYGPNKPLLGISTLGREPVTTNQVSGEWCFDGKVEQPVVLTFQLHAEVAVSEERLVRS